MWLLCGLERRIGLVNIVLPVKNYVRLQVKQNGVLRMKPPKNSPVPQREKRVAVALQPYPPKKRDRIVEEMKLIIEHDTWELSLPLITQHRRGELVDRIIELEEEIDRR